MSRETPVRAQLLPKLIVLAVALKFVVVNARLVVKDTDVKSAAPAV